MTTYRIYAISRDGGRTPPRDIESVDDAGAFADAAELAQGARSAEVWVGTKLLGEVRAADAEVHPSLPPITFPGHAAPLPAGL